MQDRVGGSAKRNDHGDGIFERFACHDVERLNVLTNEINYSRASALTVANFVVRDGLLRRTVCEAHAECLDSGCHRVGRIHATACTGAGNGGSFHFQKFRSRYFFGRSRAYGFEHRDDVTTFTTWLNGAAVNEYRRSIQSRHRHDAGWHILVTSADSDHTVKSFGTCDCFNRVSDDFA